MTADGFDLTFMHATEPVLGAQQGMTLMRTHPASRCAGREIPCCVHAPSLHHMRGWPMNWRADTAVMERLCPHGVGHPDPDHMAYVLSLTPEHDCAGDCVFPHLDWQGVHGCDGCCRAAA